MSVEVLIAYFVIQWVIFSVLLVGICKKEKRSTWWVLAAITPISFVIAIALLVRDEPKSYAKNI